MGFTYSKGQLPDRFYDRLMEEPAEDPAPDDTAAFQRFYAQEPEPRAATGRGILYRLLVSWWRDRR